MIYTLDNHRLYGFQQAYEQAGFDIPYQKLDSVPSQQLFKFTTQNDGTSILIRKQGAIGATHDLHVHRQAKSGPGVPPLVTADR
ncbi:MAG TPA: hypothetical protein VIM98_07365 [Dyella sp.]|uniref:hypothetical protein n=1 Tax=Dyella sp. TaxID=1869338 RepID=UPI002F92B76A